jgi:quinol monooxygenase YgiN
MVTILAQLEAKPGKEEELLKELKVLVEFTIQEHGCIFYNLHQDMEDSCKFYFYERFKDMEAFEKHSGSPHIQEFGKKAESLLLRPGQITFLEPK